MPLTNFAMSVIFRCSRCVVVAAFCSSLLLAQQLPVGTAIPIALKTGLEASKDNSDKTIEGEVMQDVTTTTGVKINQGSRVHGHLINVTKPSGSGSSITLKFDAIEDHGHRIPITVSLVAVASMMDVSQAGLPVNTNAYTDSINDWVTRQVGGDIVRRGQGKVFSRTGEVGKWLQGGGVLIKLTPNPAAGCPNGPAYESEQSVWIFSSDACGVYGDKKLKIAKSGSSAPMGDIVLQSPKNIEIRGGSGLLLTVVERP